MTTLAALLTDDGTTEELLDLTAYPYRIVDGSWDILNKPDTVAFRLEVSGRSGNDRADNIAQVQRYLNLAARVAGESHQPWVGFAWALDTDEIAVVGLTGGELGLPAATMTGTIIEKSRRLFITVTLATVGTPRLYPVSRWSATGLTAENPTMVMANVPGDRPGLTRLTAVDQSSGGKQIMDMRVVRRAARSTDDAETFSPWVDLAELDAGNDTPDVTAIGDSYVTVTTSDTDGVTIARAEQPDGALNRGRFDLYARVWDTATDIGTPGTPTGTVVAPTEIPGASTSTSTATTPASLGVHDDDSTTSTSGTATITLSTSGRTAGSTYIIMARETPDCPGGTLSGIALSMAISGEPGAHISKVVEEAVVDGTEAYLLAGWIVRNVSNANNIVVSGTGPVSGVEVDAAFIELLNVGTNPILERRAVAFHAASVSLSVTTGPTTDNVVVVMGSIDTDHSGAASGTFLGFTGDVTQVPMGAWLQVSGVQQSVGTDVMFSTGSWSGFAVALQVPVTTTTTTDPSTFVTPLPGALKAGSYQIVAQAVDLVNGLGNASGTLTKAVSDDNSRIDLATSAATGADHYRWVVRFAGDCYEGFSSGTTFTLDDLASLNPVPALPATSGAVASPARLQLRVGTVGGICRAGGIREVVLTGAGAWRDVFVAGARDMPPADAWLDGTRQDWASEIDIRSGNGRPVTVRVDALFLAPTDEGQLRLERTDTGTTTPATWQAETHRSGLRTTAVALDDDGDVLDPLTSVGTFMPEPGDNALAFLVTGEDGVADLALAFDVDVTIWPGVRWLAGGR